MGLTAEAPFVCEPLLSALPFVVPFDATFDSGEDRPFDEPFESARGECGLLPFSLSCLIAPSSPRRRLDFGCAERDPEFEPSGSASSADGLELLRRRFAVLRRVGPPIAAGCGKFSAWLVAALDAWAERSWELEVGFSVEVNGWSEAVGVGGVGMVSSARTRAGSGLRGGLGS